MSKGRTVDESQRESETQINNTTTTCLKHLATTFTQPKGLPLSQTVQSPFLRQSKEWRRK